MTDKIHGIILYSKKIKDNDLFIKILSSTDEIISGLVYGGNSSKKKLIYQNGYFIEFFFSKKNNNMPFTINAEISKPYLGNIINDKYKLNALLSILSLINISIIEGQKINGFYESVHQLISNIVFQNRWIVYYCKWLFNLLKLIGYQIDYKKNIDKEFFDIVNQNFLFKKNDYTIKFPHILFRDNPDLNFENINSIFLIFENIFSKNHLDNLNYKMPINFLNFKNIILKRLQLL